ncbi:leishmanolysin-like peptidase [Galendromus occidentalis]|uniref:Leishmanolysin-like peptidase n=1 Tax=Galendromus occidentalis TaxID=34638 RepID=A0AAJ7SDW6_9ACAR|nr:leishmanolysin-like peptidase [Galendromus occidentalis]
MTPAIIGLSTFWAAFLLISSAAHPLDSTSRGGSLCSYRRPTLDDVLPPIHLGDAKPRRVRRQEASSLRIRYFYHNESISQLTPVQFDLIDKSILPAAVDYWQQNLRPRYPLNTPIKLNRRCPEDKVFFLPGEQNQYCRDKCEEVSLCGEVPVPREHLAPCRTCNSYGRNCHTHEEEFDREGGVADADFVLYVSAIEGEKCTQGETIAYAVHCQQEAEFDRPIAGHANLCPSTLLPEEQHVRTLLSTVKHEVLHALGFSVSLFAFFRDDDGNPITPRSNVTGRPDIDEELMVHRWSDRIVRSVEMPWKTTTGMVLKKRNFVVTPRVVEAVRTHFGCPNLIGAELEDQGDDGTRLTHWEKRVFENEAMTGTNTQNPVYSKVTFALMEDSGWYWTTNGHDDLLWGRNLGCNFTTMSCFEWMKWRKETGNPIFPYCDTVKRNPLRTTCTETRNAVALCNLVQYPVPLPEDYRFFDQIDGIGGEYAASFGSSVALADYCPFIQEFTWANSGRNSECSFAVNQPSPGKNFALETYGKESRCFHTDRWKESNCATVRHWQNWGSACYQHRCDNGLLEIILSTNATLRCVYRGQKIYVRILDKEGWLHSSHIVCPACEEMCPLDKCKAYPEDDSDNTIGVTDSLNQSLKCRAMPVVPVTWTIAALSMLALRSTIPLI